eukprot:sb/3476828/
MIRRLLIRSGGRFLREIRMGIEYLKVEFFSSSTFSPDPQWSKRGVRHLLFCPLLPTFAHMGKPKSQKTGILWAKWAKRQCKPAHHKFKECVSKTQGLFLSCLIDIDPAGILPT